jgi:hypothetical protein
MSAALSPLAAVRLPRPAAVRRALLTAVFLGGFIALAFVLGSGSAHAAEPEGAAASARPLSLTDNSLSGTVRDTVEGLTTTDNATSDSATSDVAKTGSAAEAAGTHAVDDLDKTAIAPAARNLRKAGDTAERVITPVTDDAARQTHAITGLVHDLTGVSVPPIVPGAPIVGTPPGSDRPVHHGPVRRTAPGHGAHQASHRSAVELVGPAHHHYGSAAYSRTAPDTTSRQNAPGRAPAHRPGGTPEGFVSQVDDSNASHRTTNPYAAVWGAAARSALVPGSVRKAIETPLCERPFEVLELPG